MEIFRYFEVKIPKTASGRFFPGFPDVEITASLGKLQPTVCNIGSKLGLQFVVTKMFILAELHARKRVWPTVARAATYPTAAIDLEGKASMVAKT